MDDQAPTSHDTHPQAPAYPTASPEPSPPSPIPSWQQVHQANQTEQKPSTQTPQNHHVPAGQIVLQWLTYSFWGWTILALSSLIVSVLAFYVADSDTSGFAPFGIAAALVLLPISAATDYFYKKHEPAKKIGAAAVVMIIHAVIFALCGIGSIIAAVFTLVQMFTNTSTDPAVQVGLYSALLIGVLYGAVFVRTLRPIQLLKPLKFYTAGMSAIIGIVIILTIVGPVFRERATQQDRLIENSLGDLSNGVRSYATAHSNLPSDLENLELSEEAQKLVDQNLVIYKPNIKPADSGQSSTNFNSTYNVGTNQGNKKFYYELCATYKQKSSGYSEYGYDRPSQEYATYLSAYRHPAGEVCYKLRTGY